MTSIGVHRYIEQTLSISGYPNARSPFLENRIRVRVGDEKHDDHYYSSQRLTGGLVVVVLLNKS